MEELDDNSWAALLEGVQAAGKMVAAITPAQEVAIKKAFQARGAKLPQLGALALVAVAQALNARLVVRHATKGELNFTVIEEIAQSLFERLEAERKSKKVPEAVPGTLSEEEFRRMFGSGGGTAH